jgi:hypothetical protein
MGRDALTGFACAGAAVASAPLVLVQQCFKVDRVCRLLDALTLSSINKNHGFLFVVVVVCTRVSGVAFVWSAAPHTRSSSSQVWRDQDLQPGGQRAPNIVRLLYRPILRASGRGRDLSATHTHWECRQHS